MSHLLRHSLLGVLRGANFNSTADQAIKVNASKYVVRKVITSNASTSLSLAVGGIYNDTSKPAGGIVVAASQVYSALTGAGKFVDSTLNSLVTTDIQTAATLYLSLTVAQGSAATADVYIFGDTLES